MTSLRVLFLVVAGCCFLRPQALPAQSPTFMMGKQFSADQVIVTKENTLTNKIYMDGGKIRLEMKNPGADMTIIILPKDKMMLMVMPDQKMVMKRPYNAEEMKKRVPASAAADATFTLVGPDLLDGTACTKYKMTDKDGQVIYLWVNTAKQVPAKMTDAAGTFTMLWKNYQAGPQNPALFDAPDGYQLIDLPGGIPGGPPGLPSGLSPGAGQ